MPISPDLHFDNSDLNRNLRDCNLLHSTVGSLNPRNRGLHNDLIQFAKKLMRRSLAWYTRPLHQFQGSVTRTLNELTKSVEHLQAAVQQNVEAVQQNVEAVQQNVEAVQQNVEAVHQIDSAWRQNIPAFLNAVSTVNAFGFELRKVRADSDHGIQAAREELSRQWSQERQSLCGQLSQIERQIDQVESDCKIAKRLEPEVNSLRGNVQQISESVSATWERIEFTRREMMYEMKYSGPFSRAAYSPSPELEHFEPQTVDPQKVALARESGLKLNLGCGHIPIEGYVNVDRRALPGIDVIADVSDLPFEQGTVEEIFSAHLLEHFPQEKLRRLLLPQWHRLLRPGGTFRAVVPDGEAMLAGLAAGTYPFYNFREVLFGAQEYDGDFHFNLFTPESLSALLKEAGFAETRVTAKARPNGICFEFEVSAKKGDSTAR